MSFMLPSRKLTQAPFDERLRKLYESTVREGTPQWALDLLAKMK